MILLRALLALLGLALVAGTLISAVRTFVLPRGVPDRLTSAVFVSARYLFDLALRWTPSYEARDRLLAFYAPLSLLALPAVWLALVLVGYAALFWAAGSAPAHAFMISGSSLLTLGFATPSSGAATALTFSEAAIGLTLAALLISFLPTMYGAFARREANVTSLEARAGSPPSAVTLLVRYRRIERLDRLGELWPAWESWFIDIEESHTSLAPLVFYRSPQPDRSWVTAAGAILDTAALAASTLDRPRDSDAELFIRTGYIALRRIADTFSIPYNPDPRYPDTPISVAREEYDAACDRLAAAGIALKADRDAAWRAFAGWRVNYDAVLVGLAVLVMAPEAPWSSDRAPKHGRRRLFFRPDKRARRVAAAIGQGRDPPGQ